MKKLIALLWLAVSICTQLIAEAWISDAFGLYQGNDPFRASWSGLTLICEDDCEVKEIASGETETLSLFIGAKSLVVNKEIAMALTIAHDEFGNLSGDGALVSFFLDSHNRTLIAPVRDGLAFSNFTASRRAGDFLGSAAIGDVQSASQHYRQLPDLASMNPEFSAFPEEITQGARFEMQTETLTDRYGNAPSLGALATAIIRDDQGNYSVQPLLSDDARFEALPYASAEQDHGDAVLYFGQATSAPAHYDVEDVELVGEPQVYGVYHEDAGVADVIIANLRTNQEHLIMDGTEFRLHITDAEGQTRAQTLYSLDGALSFTNLVTEELFPLQVTAASDFGIISLSIAYEEIADSATNIAIYGVTDKP